MILVSISCTENYFFKYSHRLSMSMDNIKSVLNDKVFFLMVLQAKHKPDLSQSFLREYEANSFLLKKVNYLSVSKSRNEGYEYALNNDFSQIIFHDVSLIYTKSYISWVAKQPKGHLVAGNWLFTVKDDKYTGVAAVSKVISFNCFADTFVCSYVFPVSNVFPKFDERFGPGEFSIFTSGEDFLFLREYFVTFPEQKCFKRFIGGAILHPPRPSDYSKHLSYAFGQGKIHQVFLLQERSIYSLWRCLLFFGNAFFRIVLLKKNSFEILKLRIKGFFDTSVKV